MVPLSDPTRRALRDAATALGRRSLSAAARLILKAEGCLLCDRGIVHGRTGLDRRRAGTGVTLALQLEPQLRATLAVAAREKGVHLSDYCAAQLKNRLDCPVSDTAAP